MGKEMGKEPGKSPRFSLGQVVATRGVSLGETNNDILRALYRHIRGDWGELCEEDKQLNEEALQIGARLLSKYTLPSTGRAVWVITEADRSVTTVLYPSEY